jgi:NitT/TauT family transport system substrate-binding protein
MSEISRRQFLLRAGGAAYGIPLGAALISMPQPGKAAGTVSISEQVDWTVSNRIMGEVVAKSLGYFEEEGIDLSIILGGPNIDGVASVASGRAAVGLLSSSPSLMLARAGGIPIKCVAAGFQQHPFTYFSLSKNPIRTPEDFRGKRVGTSQTSVILLKALLKKNNIPEDQVKVVVIGPDVAPLLTGQVDAVTNWATDATPLKPLGPDRVELRLWDCGVRLYANPFYATEATLKERPDVVAAFIRATARGWGYVKANPEKAVDLFVKAYPVRDREAELASVGLALSYVFTKETAQSGWGAMQKEVWAEQLQMYDELGQFANRSVPKLDDIVTLDILKSTEGARPKLS